MTKKMTKKETIDKLKVQITQLETGIADIDAKLDRYSMMVENWRELQELKIEGVKQGILNPEYPHHKNPRFWELQANEMQYTVEEESASQDGQIAGFIYQKEALTTEKVTLEKELSKLEE